MKGLRAGVFAVVLILTALIPLSQGPQEPKDSFECPNPHAPILINGNAQFTPANGVTGGSGTQSDPYIISGWNISAFDVTGIMIMNTDTHFDVRDVCVHSGDGTHSAVSFERVRDGQLENSSVQNNTYGVSLSYVTNVSLLANRISSSLFSAIGVDGSENVTIAFNNVSLSQTRVIEIEYTTNVVISSNDIFSNSHWTLSVISSTNISISLNRFYSNLHHVVYVDSSRSVSIDSNDMFSNEAWIIQTFRNNGMSISHNRIHSNVGHGISASWDAGLSISNNSVFSNSQEGISVDFTDGAYIAFNSIHSNGYPGGHNGIELGSSTNALITANDIWLNGADGINVQRSANITVTSNNISFNNQLGPSYWSGAVFFYDSINATVSGNNISSNGAQGIELKSSDLMFISDNTIMSNEMDGISLTDSTNASIFSNIISSTHDHGIHLRRSIGNSIFHNLIVNNTDQAFDEMGGENAWDDGYPSGGNYWSDYTGMDCFSGPNQDLPFSDGIGDTPYVIDSYIIGLNSRDRYPLMGGSCTNHVPIADAGGPYNGYEGSSIPFDGSGSSDPDNDTLQFRWDFDGDGTWDTSWSQSPYASHTWGDDWSGEAILEVSDGGLTANDTAQVNVANILPSGTITITNYMQVEGAPIVFVAHITDPGSDDVFLTWHWGFGAPDEDSTYYNNGASPDPYPSTDVHPRDIYDSKYHTYGDNGAFMVTVDVSDDDSGTRATTLTLIATPNNLPPSVNVDGGTTIDEGQSILLNATATDPGSDDLKFSWSWGDNSSENRIYYNDGVGPDPPQSPGGTWPFNATDAAAHAYGDNGQYTLALTIADDDGGSTTWSGQVVVKNLPPSIEPFGPFTVDEGSPLSISATATDAGSDDLAFTWRFELGPTISNTHYNNGVSPDPYPSPGPIYPFTATDSVTATYGDNGVYVLNLTVKDDDGGVSWYETDITVVNKPPSIQPFGPFTVDEGSPLNVSATATDQGSDDLMFTWSLELGPTIQDIHYNDGIGPDPTKSPWGTFPFTAQDSASHTYGDNSVYVLNLTVTDDDGGAAYYSAEVTVLNLPPVIEQFGPFHAQEGDPLTIDANATDAGSDDLTFAWSWEYGPTFQDIQYNDGIGPDPPKSPWGTFPLDVADSTSHIYGDNGVFTVSLTVEDDDGGVAWYNTTVTVDNVPPVIDDVRIYVEANFTLRVAGEKWHDVCMDLVHDGNIESQACIVRYPGSPDDQSKTITGRIQLLGDFKVVLYYTPDDDTVNGQPNGANPAWVTIEFPDGLEVSLHHNFNVQHSDTWVWTIDDFRPYLIGQTITFNATASDVGSDDLTFTWSFGDGAPDATTTYFNNGIGPDPYPSPEVNPMTATDIAAHIYSAAGTYAVNLTVIDDDGGSTLISAMVEA